MVKERKCLKFTGYIYIPDEKSTKNDLRYHAARTPGRLILFDEFGDKQQGKAIAFENTGAMLNHIEKARQKLIYKRVKRTK